MRASTLRAQGKAAQAFQLFEQAAAEGSTEALGWLGLMLLSAEGVAADPQRAYQVASSTIQRFF